MKELLQVLLEARPCWSFSDVAGAGNKLAKIGIQTVEELTAALQERRELNQRLRLAGFRTFHSDTVRELRAALDVRCQARSGSSDPSMEVKSQASSGGSDSVMDFAEVPETPRETTLFLTSTVAPPRRRRLSPVTLTRIERERSAALEAAASKGIWTPLRCGRPPWQPPEDEKEWKRRLTFTEYEVLRQGKTEDVGTHPYVDFFPKKGYFACRGCGLPLYAWSSKFLDTGWPTWGESYHSKDLGCHTWAEGDRSEGYVRISCTRCESHLGHVYYDEEDQGCHRERH